MKNEGSRCAKVKTKYVEVRVMNGHVVCLILVTESLFFVWSQTNKVMLALLITDKHKSSANLGKAF